MKSVMEKFSAAKYDKNQTLIVDGKLKPNTFLFAVVEEKKIDFTKKETCPFCLSWLPLNAFIISTKKGYHQSLGKCKACGQGMKLKTIFTLGKGTPEAYAKFVVEYPPGAFFEKVKQGLGFERWKARLKLMGWSQRFWEEYRRLNPKFDDENEEKYKDYEASFQ